MKGHCSPRARVMMMMKLAVERDASDEGLFWVMGGSWTSPDILVTASVKAGKERE